MMTKETFLSVGSKSRDYEERQADKKKCKVFVIAHVILCTAAVTVIWVPLWFVYPHTHITRDMSIPCGDIQREAKIIRSGRKIIYSVFIFLILQQTCIMSL